MAGDAWCADTHHGFLGMAACNDFNETKKRGVSVFEKLIKAVWFKDVQ